MSRIRRLLKRPSLRLARSILLPLTVIHVAVTVYAMVVAHRASVSLEFDRVEGIAEALAMAPAEGSGLTRLAFDLSAERVWLASATGRIIGSNRASEIDALVDDVWWQNLPVDQRRFRREATWGGRDYVQIAYHNVEGGVWSMVISTVESRRGQSSARLLAILVLSVSVWLLMLGAVVTAVQRQFGKSLDVSDMVAKRVLKGEAVSTASLARTQASTSNFGPGTRLLQLVEKMQQQASRANEAESRFSLAVELLPGLAYLASYEGELLYAGPMLRQRFAGESWMGKSVAAALHQIPFDRVHAAATQSQSRGVTFDNLPIREEYGDRPGMVASVRSVLFRGVPAYLAHIETVNDAGHRTPARSSVVLEAMEAQLVDQASEIIIAFDATTRTLVWNSAAAKLTGVPSGRVPDLKTAIETLSVNPESVTAFADWMDGTPEEVPLVLEYQAHDRKRYRISWTARELTKDGQTLGGALFGVPSLVEVSQKRSRRRISRTRRKKKHADRTS